jgi:hypothetical protein
MVWSTGKGASRNKLLQGLLEEKKLFNHCVGSDTDLVGQILDIPTVVIHMSSARILSMKTYGPWFPLCLRCIIYLPREAEG